jgi:chaperone modulatory protein CbpM
MTTKISIINGCILEEESSLTLAELCQTCQAPAETIIRLIDYGVITPCKGTTSREWRFHRNALVRTDKALRIKRDLGVNLAGTALVLELLDEIDILRKKLARI